MSTGRKMCLVETRLSVEQVRSVFCETMFGRGSAVTFVMDSGNRWLPLEDASTIGARCSPGIPARMGGPRPRAMVGTVIALTARPVYDGDWTCVRIQVLNRKICLGVMPGALGVGRHLKRIARAIAAQDATASIQFENDPDGQRSMVAGSTGRPAA